MTQSSNAPNQRGHARVLLLTRPEQQSRDFAAECEAVLTCPIPIVISPILKIEPVATTLDLDGYKTLIVTSRHAVEQMGTGLKNRRTVTVGEQTARLATDFGADATCLGHDVEGLLEKGDRIAFPAVHLRGVHSRGCLAKRLSEAGVMTDEHIIYDQVEQALNDEGKAALQSGHAVVPVFSPRSAKILSSYRVDPHTRVLAISQAARDAWQAPGVCFVASHPDRKAMRDLVVASL